ncbi:MAG: hypothetical protein ACYDAR_11545 [Thermomicrobiales bacterium]
MTLTIAARWRLTFRVQSLARVTMPATTPIAAPKRPDLLAIAQARRLHDELEMERFRWEANALTSFRRMM